MTTLEAVINENKVRKAINRYLILFDKKLDPVESKLKRLGYLISDEIPQEIRNKVGRAISRKDLMIEASSLEMEMRAMTIKNYYDTIEIYSGALGGNLNLFKRLECRYGIWSFKRKFIKELNGLYNGLQSDDKYESCFAIRALKTLKKLEIPIDDIISKYLEQIDDKGNIMFDDKDENERT